MLYVDFSCLKTVALKVAIFNRNFWGIFFLHISLLSWLMIFDIYFREKLFNFEDGRESP